MRRLKRALLMPWAGGGAGLVNPASVAGVKEWWKASSIAQGDSTAVTTWTGSLQSIAPTQATAGSKPTYRAASGPNSTPCVSFDGGDNLATTTLASTLIASNACHIFIIMKQTGTDAQNCPVCALGVNGFEGFLSYDDVLYWDFAGTGGAGSRVSVAQPVGWDDTWQMVQLIRESPNTGVGRIRAQGAELVNGVMSTTSTISTSVAFAIGAQQTSGAIGFTGFITDILIYNVALGTTDRQSVEAYFNSLYTLF
jgi:hypothetical protein